MEENRVCVACFVGEDLVSTTECDTENIAWRTKLTYCLPELNWDVACFVCKACAEQLDTLCKFRTRCLQSYAKLHAAPLTFNDLISCPKCNISFPTTATLEAHDLITHAIELFESKVESTKKSPPPAKRKKRPPDEPSRCERCSTTFSTRYLLNRHVRNVHAVEKKHDCDVCGRTFASPVYLAAHKKYHTGSRPHICPSCGKGYITASDLYHHEKIHANKRAYKCDECPKAFNTSSDLHKHRTCVHMDRSLWKYVCAYCDRRFPLKTNLDTHTKSHTGERAYACHLCDQRCVNRSVLRRHVLSHSNVRSHRCAHCDQEYKHRKSLDVHLARTHGVGDAKVPPPPVRRYLCSVCPKTFCANNKLQKHVRTHTGERPYSCRLCDKRFIDKSYVKQHVRTAHGVAAID